MAILIFWFLVSDGHFSGKRKVIVMVNCYHNKSDFPFLRAAKFDVMTLVEPYDVFFLQALGKSVLLC